MKRFFSLSVFLVLLAFVSGCGRQEPAEKPSAPEESKPKVIKHSGTIESGDVTDPNHGNLSYDPYTFEAKPGDRVEMQVKTDEFEPLLKLVEVSTGAVLSEWHPKYSEVDRMTYTIAGPGKYEARVYAMKNGTGGYTLSISIK